MLRWIVAVPLLSVAFAGCGGEPPGAREVSVSPTSDKPSGTDSKATKAPGKAIATH